MVNLSNLKDGEKCVITDILTKESIRRRFQDIGLIVGSEVECLGRAIFGDPVAYLIKDTVIAIRNEDASEIIVEI